MLGIDARAAVPQPSPQVARLEILPSADANSSEIASTCKDVNQFTFHLKWPGQLPVKCMFNALLYTDLKVYMLLNYFTILSCRANIPV